MYVCVCATNKFCAKRRAGGNFYMHTHLQGLMTNKRKLASNKNNHVYVYVCLYRVFLYMSAEKCEGTEGAPKNMINKSKNRDNFHTSAGMRERKCMHVCVCVRVHCRRKRVGVINIGVKGLLPLAVTRATQHTASNHQRARCKCVRDNMLHATYTCKIVARKKLECRVRIT